MNVLLQLLTVGASVRFVFVCVFVLILSGAPAMSLT